MEGRKIFLGGMVHPMSCQPHDIECTETLLLNLSQQDSFFVDRMYVLFLGSICQVSTKYVLAPYQLNAQLLVVIYTAAVLLPLGLTPGPK